MYLDDSKSAPILCNDDQLRWAEETSEQLARRRKREAHEAARRARRVLFVAITKEQIAYDLLEKLGYDFVSRYEETRLELGNALLESKIADQEADRARLAFHDIRERNIVLSAMALEKAHNEVVIVEEVMKEVEQVTMFNTIAESSEGEVMVEEEEQVQPEPIVQEDCHLVEPEIIDFIFAPDDFSIYEKARLREALPKIFSLGNRSRSRSYPAPCHNYSRKTSPLAHKPEPTHYREYTQVRGWSINELKWPWQFKVNKVFEWRLELGVSRLRSFSSLSVWK